LLDSMWSLLFMQNSPQFLSVVPCEASCVKSTLCVTMHGEFIRTHDIRPPVYLVPPIPFLPARQVWSGGDGGFPSIPHTRAHNSWQLHTLRVAHESNSTLWSGPCNRVHQNELPTCCGFQKLHLAPQGTRRAALLRTKRAEAGNLQFYSQCTQLNHPT
jgi:hypothetical protein